MLFKPKTSGAAAEVAKSHYNILQAIADNFQHRVVIFDNQGKTLTNLKSPETVDEYLQRFKLHFIKENKEKHRGQIYFTLHRIHSKVPLSEIRKHHVIATLLKKYDTKMTAHLWREDEIKISN